MFLCDIIHYKYNEEISEDFNDSAFELLIRKIVESDGHPIDYAVILVKTVRSEVNECNVLFIIYRIILFHILIIY